MTRWCVLILLAGLAAAAAPGEEEVPLRREAALRFAVDEAVQARGGVQYWVSLQDAVNLDLLEFDPEHQLRSARHVLQSRLVHTLDKDASFFTPERTLDVEYMNAVAPGYEISPAGPGRFRAGRTPANDFTVRHLEVDPAPGPREPGVAQLIDVCGLGTPESVVVQDNRGFEKVWGFRTAEASTTWTGHYRLGPGRTRVCVVSMSYIYTLPPFFLGGATRVLEESLREAVKLIRMLRAYQ